MAVDARPLCESFAAGASQPRELLTERSFVLGCAQRPLKRVRGVSEKAAFVIRSGSVRARPESRLHPGRPVAMPASSRISAVFKKDGEELHSIELARSGTPDGGRRRGGAKRRVEEGVPGV